MVSADSAAVVVVVASSQTSSRGLPETILDAFESLVLTYNWLNCEIRKPKILEYIKLKCPHPNLNLAELNVAVKLWLRLRADLQRP